MIPHIPIILYTRTTNSFDTTMPAMSTSRNDDYKVFSIRIKNNLSKLGVPKNKLQFITRGILSIYKYESEQKMEFYVAYYAALRKYYLQNGVTATEIDDYVLGYLNSYKIEMFPTLTSFVDNIKNLNEE